VILITSSVKGEGKTTVSANTALSLAGSGRNALIGADIRNPQLAAFYHPAGQRPHRLFDFGPATRERFYSGFRASSAAGRAVQRGTGNPNDLLDMPKFDEMIKSLKADYDYIVMDSAPVMLVSDLDASGGYFRSGYLYLEVGLQR
jgi:Mrp family chromosome partitioning ATPase